MSGRARVYAPSHPPAWVALQFPPFSETLLDISTARPCGAKLPPWEQGGSIMDSSIQASVGRGAVNDRKDVLIVQRLLNRIGVDAGPEDGLCGPRTIAAITDFQDRFMASPNGLIEVDGLSWGRLTAAADGADDWSGDSSKWPQEKKLRSLDPAFRPQVATVMDRLRQRGFEPKIFFAWRSVAVQRELVEQGRSRVRFSFHNAQQPDGTPNAYAVDIIDRRWGWGEQAEENGFWEALGEEAKTLGLYWGGDWTSFKDYAHIQALPNSELARIKRESGL